MVLCKGCSGCEPGGVNSGIGSTQVWPKSQPNQVKPKLDLTEIQAYLIVDSLTMRFKWLIRKVSVRGMQWFCLLNFPHKCSILGWQCINIPNSKTLQNREESPISSVFSSFDPDLMSKFHSPFMVLPSMCHFWQQKKGSLSMFLYQFRAQLSWLFINKETWLAFIWFGGSIANFPHEHLNGYDCVYQNKILESSIYFIRKPHGLTIWV